MCVYKKFKNGAAALCLKAKSAASFLGKVFPVVKSVILWYSI
jgi:hypothetical protein